MDEDDAAKNANGRGLVESKIQQSNRQGLAGKDEDEWETDEDARTDGKLTQYQWHHVLPRSRVRGTRIRGDTRTRKGYAEPRGRGYAEMGDVSRDDGTRMKTGGRGTLPRRHRRGHGNGIAEEEGTMWRYIIGRGGGYDTRLEGEGEGYGTFLGRGLAE